MIAVVSMAAVVLNVLAQISVTVSAPAAAGARDPVLVQVEVTAPAGRHVQVLPPSFAPFRVITSTSVASLDSAAARRSGALRAVWQSVEHRYVLAPPADAVGRYSFGPFEAQVTAPGLRTAVAHSRSWSITMRQPTVPTVASGSLPAIVERANVNPGTGINFHALVVPDTVYVGQQASYQVGVFLDEGVRTRLRRNPEFLPPELRAMLAYELPAGRASIRDRIIAGRRWDVHVFQRAIFPLAPGRTDIPPAQLSYSLPLSLGFFSREESYTARSEPTSVVALAPPAAGRPTDWVGAVGVLHASARLDTSTVRVGDPLVLTVRVEGTGNVKLLPRPPLSLSWGSAVAGEERVEVDSSVLLVRGAKEFDWIITPRSTGDRDVAVRYPYFDPYARQYEVTTTSPLPVHVAPGTLASTDDVARRPALAIRTHDSGPIRAPFSSHLAYWLLIVLAPMPAIAVVIARRPRRARPLTPPWVELADMARAPVSVDVRLVRRAFAAALAERLALRASGAHVASAKPGVMIRRLRRCGVTLETAEAVEAHQRRLDAAAYDANASERRASGGALAGESRSLFDRVDQEARTSAALRATTTRDASRLARVLLVGICALVGARLALAAAGPSDFGQGVKAYADGRYTEAHRDFTRVTTQHPRSADAWANAGTAAWASDDTVTAAIGWQHALRLDPRADDVRDRLSLLPTSQDGWIANVPALPIDWVATIGGALWIVGCGLLLAKLLARAPSWPLGAFASVAFVAASAVAIVGVQVQRVSTARDLALVRTTGALRIEPALGAEPGAPVQATEIAHVLARQSVWAHVALDGGRDGWVEMDRLAPLDGAP